MGHGIRPPTDPHSISLPSPPSSHLPRGFWFAFSHAAVVIAPPPLVAMAETFTPKNVMITGGAGFIASHVAILFAKKYPNYKARSSTTMQLGWGSPHESRHSTSWVWCMRGGSERKRRASRTDLTLSRLRPPDS